MWRARLLVLALLAGGLLNTPATAEASPAAVAAQTSALRTAGEVALCTGFAACNSVGRSNFGYEGVYTHSYWSQDSGHNCTNYVGFRFTQAGIGRPSWAHGGAAPWGDQAGSLTNGTPAVGAIAWWRSKGSAGHVAIVEQVNADGSFVTSDDVYGGDFHWRQYSPGSAAWPSGFIHLNDAALGGGGGGGGGNGGPVSITASNNGGEMAIQLSNFPLGKSYFFCHAGSGYPSGGSVTGQGSVIVSDRNQSWSSGWCSGSGNFWVGVQAPDGHDYYSNQVTLGSSPPGVQVGNAGGQMTVQLSNFPTGTAYFFCHSGSGYPTGGSVPNHGSVVVTDPNQSWSSGWCSGSGNFWIGIQAADGHDYYSNEVTLGTGGTPSITATNLNGQMGVQVDNFPTGRTYYFCHTGSGYPTGGSVPNHGYVDVSSSSQSWTGLCAGTGNFWIGVQATDGHDYYSNEVTLGPPPAPPSAPEGVSATPGNASAVVSWTAPADGGSPLSGYTVTSAPGDYTCSAPSGSQSCTVTGLTNGSSYTFTVTAINAIGVSPASSPSAAITPATVPARPGDLQVTRNKSRVTVRWAVGGDGGSPIIGFLVWRDNKTNAVVWPATSATYRKLASGRHRFKVAAMNELGTSPWTRTVTIRIH